LELENIYEEKKLAEEISKLKSEIEQNKKSNLSKFFYYFKLRYVLKYNLFNTVILSFLKRERERTFANVSDRLTSLAVHRS
jgi:hypothetical protein